MRAFLVVFAFAFIMFSCAEKKAGEQPVDTTTGETGDSNKSTVVVPKVSKNQRYDDLACYLSGIQQHSYTTIPQEMLNDSTWKWYCVEMDKSWLKYDQNRLSTIINWSNSEMNDIKKDTATLFYPFSGPDFLHANAFFPSTNKMMLAGLEPVGKLPSFTEKKSIPGYLKSMHQSLYAVLNFSFFKTNDMKTDMNAKELNGTLHLMMMFVKRSGYEIADIRPLRIDSTGIVHRYASFDVLKDSLYQGAEIVYFGKDSVLRSVEYYSIDLSNYKTSVNAPFLKYVENKKPFNTYLKSASNLMHKSYFSNVKDVIINNSKNVVQDDSGVPYKYFKANEWNISLYGSYNGTIDLFEVGYQKDLEEAYKDTAAVKDLPFGIGYKHRKGTSNLMIARRSGTPAKSVKK